MFGVGERLLFTLISTDSTPPREHRVMWWPHYGVVCPSLVTTNGSAGTFLMAVVGRNYAIRPGLLAPKDDAEMQALLVPWVVAKRERERVRGDLICTHDQPCSECRGWVEEVVR